MNIRTFATTTAALLTTLVVAGTAEAASKKLPFKNDTGQAANDLHIEFKQGVTPKLEGGSYGAFDNYNSSPGSSSAEFDGGSVADGATTKIRFENGGPKITVKKWWWTKDGNRIGSIHTALAGASLSIDQTELNVGETVTVSAETVGDELSGGEFFIDWLVMLPDLSVMPMPPMLLPPPGLGLTCQLQALTMNTGGLMPGPYEISYVAQSLESGEVTEGTSALQLGHGCSPNE
ncbi:MAG: hypothetical protein CME06_00985 [Gemmatimonadetes bacterium]|nr:hypothetical protein [Gemmatimonadota bacterium]